MKKYCYFLLVLLPFLSSVHSYSSDDFKDFIQRVYEDQQQRRPQQQQHDSRRYFYTEDEAVRDDKYNSNRRFLHFADDDFRLNDDVAVEKCEVKPEFRFSLRDAEYVLEKTELVVRFFSRYTDQLIADGMYGMRIVQGVLDDLLKKLSKKHPLYEKTEKLTELVSKLCKVAFENMIRRNSPYDVNFAKVLRRSQTFVRPWTRLHKLKDLIEKGNLVNDDKFSETKSDNCIGLLLGSSKDSNNRTCVVTKECLDIETTPKTKGYTITHQMMYFMIGANEGCVDQLTTSLGGGKKKFDQLFNKFAANIAYQMLATEINVEHLDIALEQGVFCSILGIAECNNKHRVKEFLSFLTDRGCAENDDIVRNDRANENEIQKRQDKTIGGCSQHTGSLMGAYLASSLRFMLDPPPCRMLQ